MNGKTDGGTAHYYVSDTPDNFAELEQMFFGEYAGGPSERIAIETYYGEKGLPHWGKLSPKGP